MTGLRVRVCARDSLASCRDGHGEPCDLFRRLGQAFSKDSRTAKAEETGKVALGRRFFDPALLERWGEGRRPRCRG
jgi:hypothetical protein